MKAMKATKNVVSLWKTLKIPNTEFNLENTLVNG